MFGKIKGWFKEFREAEMLVLMDKVQRLERVLDVNEDLVRTNLSLKKENFALKESNRALLAAQKEGIKDAD